MSRRIIYGLAILILFVVSAQLPAQPGPQYSKDALALAHGNNVFATDLFGQLRKKEGNLFFSPYSISSALAMTYTGARGETAQEMATTLHFDLPPERLHRAFSEMVHAFNAKKKDQPYQLSVANALWGQKGFTFLPGFLQLVQDNYEGGLKELDFARDPEAARKVINAWVERQTQDKIQELLQKKMLTSNTRMVLTNAIYFKAPWAERFPDAATKKEDFHLSGGGKVKVAMMHKFEDLPYFGEKDLQAVAIPYKWNALSMVVLMPRKASGLADLEKSVTAERLREWAGKMKGHQVNLKLPKFKVTSEFSLADELQQLGMKLAFGDRADLSGMTSQAKLYIDKVIHKAYVDVNEKGTEAAAATAVIVAQPSAPPPQLPPATMHVDRPFLFLIQENRTGSILFIGRVASPNK
jgi:serpin B